MHYINTNDDTRIYSCETVDQVPLTNKMSLTNKIVFENTTILNA